MVIDNLSQLYGANYLWHSLDKHNNWFRYARRTICQILHTCLTKSVKHLWHHNAPLELMYQLMNVIRHYCRHKLISVRHIRTSRSHRVCTLSHLWQEMKRVQEWSNIMTLSEVSHRTSLTNQLDSSTLVTHCWRSLKFSGYSMTFTNQLFIITDTSVTISV